VPFDERLLRWLRRATVIGIAVSLLVHLVGWFLAAHMRVETEGGGFQAPMPSVVDVAVMTETELAELQEAALSSPSVPDLQQEQIPAVEALDLPSDAEFAGALSDIAPTTVGRGAGDVGSASGLGEGGSGSGSASFFGVEATGSRFVYIVDVSGSMGVGGKLQALQTELIRSIEGLLESADFLVITFSDGATPLEGRQAWSDGDERGKRFARRGVGRLDSHGSTNPAPAFHMAFGMKPPPDSIYFMTDGEFNPEVAAEVAALNTEFRVPIHCIAFVSRDSEALMRLIASQSGGSYTFVPAPSGGP
jgi:hypothetical protein